MSSEEMRIVKTGYQTTAFTLMIRTYVIKQLCIA